MTNIGREITSDITNATKLEWLVTNGIGGYASSTLPCINTRRYHGLLIASLRPPTERIVMVSRLEETLIINGCEYPLYTHIQKGKSINDKGFLYLERFEKNPLPVWFYQIKDVLVIKSLFMIYGQNTTIVTYKLLTNGNNVKLKITPHSLFRDFHGNMYENAGLKDNIVLEDRQLSLKPFANGPTLYMRWDNGSFKQKFQWHKDIFLTKEEERGLPPTEDDFSFGNLEIEKCNGSVSIAFSDEPIASFNPIDLRKREEQRLENISNSIESNDKLLKDLLIASEQFIVERKSTGSKTILAGYPWFSDWGRDSLIALPGLTLVTGRYDDAKSILKTFASSVKYGLIPNCFADVGNEASYNSVDASLWFFIAVYKYIEYTNDYAFVKKELLPAMTKIIEAFINGTIYDIKMDSKDCLISAGNKDIQLTWMDVKVDGKTITPRNGKAVEINALWYNALKIYFLIMEKFNQKYDEIRDLPQKVKENFKKLFWNSADNCLYDYIKSDGTPDLAFRPNQIFAVYLPFSLLESDEEKAIVNAVFAKLYTSYGLRSLAEDEKQYEPYYRGDRVQRDKTYHQGTVWAFLIGPFIH